jgi:HPt (histidine-containing phosphotransfer) domain-containing protein
MEHTSTQTSEPLSQEILASLRQLQGDDDPEFFRELVDIFIEETDAHLISLEQAIDQQNPDSLQKIAHALKSSSANVGAILVSKLSKELEEMGRAGQIEGAQLKFTAVKYEYERAQTALKRACTD